MYHKALLKNEEIINSFGERYSILFMPYNGPLIKSLPHSKQRERDYCIIHVGRINYIILLIILDWYQTDKI